MLFGKTSRWGVTVTLDWADLGFLAVVIACLVWAVAGVVHENAMHAEHTKAIQAGVGRWDVDFRTGERTFRYGMRHAEP